MPAVSENISEKAPTVAQGAPPALPLGDFEARLKAELLKAGALGEVDFVRADSLARKESQETLVTLLVKLGMVSERVIAETQAAASATTLLKAADYPREAVPELDISARFLKDQLVIPLASSADTLQVAVADLCNDFVLHALAFVSSRKVSPVVGLQSDIQTALVRLYDDRANTGDDKSASGEGAENFSADDVARLRDMASEAPVIRLVNQLIQRAVDGRASDIHIEPFENLLKVRYRVDGVLRDEPSPPRDIAPAVISRIKIMADLDIAERRLPQDGRINQRVQGQDMDIRVSTVPTMYGESVVMRLLRRENVTLDFDSLGFSAAAKQQIQNALAMPHGMVIVTGPTGSGKTTTLYTALNSLNTQERKVITVEDPVEYNLEGINQIQVNPGIGLTFSGALRSIVRQDPDVIMVGEMRDLETAKICVQSALTGHLVLSTLHTNDAAGSVTRLLEMGIEDYLLNSTLSMVVAQRLVRVLCTDCRESYTPDQGLIKEFRLDKLADELHPKLYRSRGCERCGGTGYRGRVGIIELLTLSEKIRQLILAHASAAAIEAAARAEGMATMFDDGCLKSLAGVTTLEEIVRVTQDN